MMCNISMSMSKILTISTLIYKMMIIIMIGLRPFLRRKETSVT